MNVLYVAFCAFVTNCKNHELIWLKFHEFPRFSNSKGNGNVDGTLVRPAVPCRVCFWPATGERLPTPAVKERCSASVQMLFFPYDVVLSENDVLEAGWRSCCVCVGNFEFRLSVWTASRVNQSQPIGSVSFAKVSCVQQCTEHLQS